MPQPLIIHSYALFMQRVPGVITDSEIAIEEATHSGLVCRPNNYEFQVFDTLRRNSTHTYAGDERKGLRKP